MKKKKVRYAVVGCGTHAIRGHILPARNVSELELVAVFDPDTSAVERAIHASGAKGVRSHRSFESLLKDPKIDAVVICTPDRFHAKNMHAAIEAKKHVLCDKPMGSTKEDVPVVHSALSVSTLFEVVCTSCHPRRFNPPYLWLKNNLEDLVERFGKALQLGLDFSYHKPSKQDLHTGLLSDHFNHEIDYMRFLFGHGATTAFRIVDEQDYYQAHGTHLGEIAFNFIGTRRLDSRVYPEFIRLQLERGDVRINTYTGHAILTSHEDSVSEVKYIGPTDYEVAFRDIMQNFADCILLRGGTAPYLSHEDLIVNTASCISLTQFGRYEMDPDA